MANGVETALGSLEAYGPAALGLVLLLGALGVPVPATMVLLAAGAFVRQGAFELPLGVGMALAGAVGGDSYLMGRYGIRRMLGRLERGVSWRKAEATFESQGDWSILLTRFLLTPLALPTNLIAGSDRYPFRRFVGLCTAGELVWVLFFGGLGYVFAESWPRVHDRIGSLGPWLVGGVVLTFGVYEICIYCRGHWKHHAPAH